MMFVGKTKSCLSLVRCRWREVRGELWLSELFRRLRPPHRAHRSCRPLRDSVHAVYSEECSESTRSDSRAEWGEAGDQPKAAADGELLRFIRKARSVFRRDVFYTVQWCFHPFYWTGTLCSVHIARGTSYSDRNINFLYAQKHLLIGLQVCSTIIVA